MKKDIRAPPLTHLIEGGLPTEGALAHVLVSKYADHLSLYRQNQILARAGIGIHRSTLAGWIGTAAFHLGPVVDRLAEHLKTSSKLFIGETTAPVLDPGRGRAKTGYLWAVARDDRSWGGADPPGIVFTYAPDRAGENAERILQGFDGMPHSWMAIPATTVWREPPAKAACQLPSPIAGRMRGAS